MAIWNQASLQWCFSGLLFKNVIPLFCYVGGSKSVWRRQNSYVFGQIKAPPKPWNDRIIINVLSLNLIPDSGLCVRQSPYWHSGYKSSWCSHGGLVYTLNRGRCHISCAVKVMDHREIIKRRTVGKMLPKNNPTISPCQWIAHLFLPYWCLVLQHWPHCLRS